MQQTKSTIENTAANHRSQRRSKELALQFAHQQTLNLLTQRHNRLVGLSAWVLKVATMQPLLYAQGLQQNVKDLNNEALHCALALQSACNNLDPCNTEMLGENYLKYGLYGEEPADFFDLNWQHFQRLPWTKKIHLRDRDRGFNAFYLNKVTVPEVVLYHTPATRETYLEPLIDKNALRWIQRQSELESGALLSACNTNPILRERIPEIKAALR